MHIPTDKQQLVQLESGDVIHSFWVASLSPKQDLIPGQIHHIWMSSDKPGLFLGNCAEFCGVQHAWMRIMVEAHPQEEFDAWEKQQAESAPEPTTESAIRGKQLFMDLICANCHAIKGTEAQGRAAPDLTHLATRGWLGSGTIENTPENLRLWLKNPQAIKPGSHMPDLKLTDSQVNDISNYLETLK